MSVTSLPSTSVQKPPNPFTPWLLPIFVLAVAYGLLALTLTEQLSHREIMERCVLVDPRRARLWSVGNVEIGLAYLGVFGGMLYYFLRLYSRSRQHLTDLSLAIAYLLISFALDYFCVQHFNPFMALLIGDAAVMTFTLAVSRQVWFQRLLGVFVPVIFLTCGVGHLLEGLSYWQLTYTVNTPWTMVTADIGFAVLVNASRFPAFIRGEDVVAELAAAKAQAQTLQVQIDARIRADELREQAEAEKEAEKVRIRAFLRDVLISVTDSKLFLIDSSDQLPLPSVPVGEAILLSETEGLRELRQRTQQAAKAAGHSEERWNDLATAASEAGMNAITHGGQGTAWVFHNDAGTVQVRVEDHGTGITMENLPRAALSRGFSTKASLGHGLKMTLDTVDRLYLLTGPAGTTVVLEQDREKPLPAWL